MMTMTVFLLSKFYKKGRKKIQLSMGASQAESDLLNKLLALEPNGVFSATPKVNKTLSASFPKKLDTNRIRFENLTFDITKKRLLDRVTGQFKPGSMTAVMGPSGSGKSTFMNRLMGTLRGGEQGGDVYIDGEKRSSLRSLGTNIGFVPQDDIMHPMLTVRQVLTFQFLLRNRLYLDVHEQERFISNLLILLQIDHVQHTICGDEQVRGVSGGQKKRVNIGMELAAYPSIIFLDEPTSGLDSTSTKVICEVLREISRKNVTIVAVIHQPRWSVFRTFDQCLLLDVGGMVVYMGPTAETSEYFNSLGLTMPPNENPADWYMDIIAKSVDDFGNLDLRNEWDLHVLRRRQEKRGKRRESLSQTNTDLTNAGLTSPPTETELSISATAGSPYTPDLQPVDKKKLFPPESESSLISDSENDDEDMDKLQSNVSYTVSSESFSIQSPPIPLLKKKSSYFKMRSPFNTLRAKKVGRSAVNRGIAIDRVLTKVFHERDELTREQFKEEMTLLMGEDGYGEEIMNAVFQQIKMKGKKSKRFRRKKVITREDVERMLRKNMRQSVCKVDLQDLAEPNGCCNLIGHCCEYMLCFTHFPRLLYRGLLQLSKPLLVAKILATGAVALLEASSHTGDASTAVTKTLVNIQINYMQTFTVVGTLSSVFSVPYFASEKVIFYRETRSGVSVLGYWLARQFISLILDAAVLSAVFSSIYYMITIPLTPFKYIYLLFFLVCAVGNSLGLFLGQIFSSNIAVMFALIIPLILGLLFPGVPTVKNMGALMKFMTTFSTTRYAVESMCVYEMQQWPEYLQFEVGTFLLQATGYRENCHRTVAITLVEMALTLKVASLAFIFFEAGNCWGRAKACIRKLCKKKRREELCTVDGNYTRLDDI